MVRLFSLITILLICLTSCGLIESKYDDLNYESITNEKGTVITKLGDSLFRYDNATIVYSEADVTTMLIKTKFGKYVYIQGPAIIEFDSLKTH